MPSRTTQPLNAIVAGLGRMRPTKNREYAVTEKRIAMRRKADRRRTERVVTDSDVARHAYELYLARSGEHGHDLDDWLQAERDLRDTVHRGSSRR
jgi:hypothetical protein